MLYIMPKNTYQTVEKPFFCLISLSEFTSQFPANQSPEADHPAHPSLFLLYINDITNQIQSNIIRLFADDSIVYRDIRSPADHHILQTDIQKLTDWSNKWQINFNTSKCHLLTITHKHKPSEFTYTIANQPISRVNSHPYLGVTMYVKLPWTKHVQSTASKSAETLGLLKRNLYPAKPKVKEAAYNMFNCDTEIRIWSYSLEPTYPK